MNRLAPFFLVIFLTACSTTEPVKIAREAPEEIRPELTAFAAYATYTIYAEQGAQIIQDPNMPDEVKLVIQAAVMVASPAVDVLLISALAVQDARAEVAIGEDPSALQLLDIAIRNLDAAYWEAKPKIAALRRAIKDIGKDRADVAILAIA